MSLADALRKILEDPEDLTELPQLIEQIGELEKTSSENELMYQERIGKLQRLNKEYLAQIPIAGEEPPAEDDTPTFEDARDYLLQTFTGGE